SIRIVSTSAPILVLHALQRAGSVSRFGQGEKSSWATPGAAIQTILGNQQAQVGGRGYQGYGVLEVRDLSRAPAACRPTPHAASGPPRSRSAARRRCDSPGSPPESTIASPPSSS